MQFKKIKTFKEDFTHMFKIENEKLTATKYRLFKKLHTPGGGRGCDSAANPNAFANATRISAVAFLEKLKFS